MQSFFEPYDVRIPAGGLKTLPIQGKFITLLANNLSTGPKVGIGQSYRGTLEKGISVELPNDEKFLYVQIYNPAASEMILIVAFSFGRIYDNRFVVSGEIDVDLTPTAIESPPALTLNAGNGFAANIAADVTRKEVIVQVSADCWFGGVDVDPATSRGTKLTAGDIFVLSCAAAVYFESVADCTISLNYLTRA
ncbi:MAG: hypothetical protein WC374_01100 [Phycisphaerae bacterium]